MLNVDLRDNLNTTLPALSTSKGQLFYASGNNALTALDPPTVNKSVLFYNTTSTGPVWRTDMTAELVQTGQAATTSGAGPSTSTYTTYAKQTFTMPTGWASAKVLVFGSVYVGSTGFGGDTNAVLRSRIQIGGTFSTWRPSNAMTTSENDTHSHNSFSTTVAGNSTFAIQGTIVSSTLALATFQNSQISWIAVRKS